MNQLNYRGFDSSRSVRAPIFAHFRELSLNRLLWEGLQNLLLTLTVWHYLHFAYSLPLLADNYLENHAKNMFSEACLLLPWSSLIIVYQQSARPMKTAA